MNYQTLHHGLNISGIIFPISSLCLFFAPRGTEQAAMLAIIAVVSTGIWAFCAGRLSVRRRLPYTQSPRQQAERSESGGS
ncbi:MAG: hypothetical protein V4724_21465 [Pseudomonadota bacterium]